jgi:hypothetical protein
MDQAENTWQGLMFYVTFFWVFTTTLISNSVACIMYHDTHWRFFKSMIFICLNLWKKAQNDFAPWKQVNDILQVCYASKVLEKVQADAGDVYSSSSLYTTRNLCNYSGCGEDLVLRWLILCQYTVKEIVENTKISQCI